jgi:hypothetical protein
MDELAAWLASERMRRLGGHRFAAGWTGRMHVMKSNVPARACSCQSNTLHAEEFHADTISFS